MRPLPTLILCWLVTGFGAAAGSVLGNAGGSQGLKAGAIAGGVLGLLAAIGAAGKLGWLPRAERRGALLGGLLGFGAAVPVTLSNMHSPVIAVLSCALVGVGALLGAGIARGWTGRAV